MSKVFSGHQPNFLPYMGFFYKMHRSDVFVLDDDVQFSRQEYQNTNFILVGGSKHRLTIPVSYNYGDKINEVRICYDGNWQKKLLNTVMMNYKKAPHFQEGYELLESHIDGRYELLADMNISLIREIADRFGIVCKILIASQAVPTELQKNERNVYQCKTLGCDVYYSGVGGKAYNDAKLYAENGIEIAYSDYKPVVYKQRAKAFVENLSVLDYIFNMGYKLPESWEAPQE